MIDLIVVLNVTIAGQSVEVNTRGGPRECCSRAVCG